MKTVIYCCATLDYDLIFRPVVRTPGVEYVLFADRPPRMTRGWSWRTFPPETSGFSQRMINRWCKFFPHRLFPEAESSVYVDGNTLVLGDLTPLLQEFADSGADLGVFLHEARRSAYEEFEFCKLLGKIKPPDHPRGEAQMAFYRAEGLPELHMFSENGVLLRRHGSALDAAMRLWWDQMAEHVQRDQLSLPYVVHKTGLAVKQWPWAYKDANPYFMKYGHRGGLHYDIKTFLHVKSRYGPLHRAAYFNALRLYDWTTRKLGVGQTTRRAERRRLIGKDA